MYKDCNMYRSQKSVISILRLFGVVPYNLLETYLFNKNTEPDFDPKAILYGLVREKIISYNPMDKCYRAVKDIPKDAYKICTFAVYNEFAKTQEEKMGKGKYPFDYVFESNNKLFQLINFSERGIYKLNFRKQLEENTSDLYKVIPIIMLVNENMNSLLERDDKGRYYLLPKDDYYIAFCHYEERHKNIPKIEVVKKKYKGGTIDEIATLEDTR